MKILGITGGVGSGKSEIVKYLEKEYGASVCRTDDVARLFQRKGTDCFCKIVARFGKEVLGEDGELDRPKLAQIVFSDSKGLEDLNVIVHPAVFRWVKEDIVEKSVGNRSLYVMETALLTGMERELCEELWYVYAREPVRRERLRKSRGYTEDQITRMIGVQPTEREFRLACTTVIDNSGDFEHTKKQIGERLKL